jgi:hypothetical protein
MKQQHRGETLGAPQALISGDGNDPKTAEIVLFLLDLTKASRDSAVLEIATLAASHLIEGLSGRMTTYPANPDSSLVHTLSRTALALAEAWKITHDVRYREAGLSIIRYLSAIPSVPLADGSRGKETITKSHFFSRRKG